MSTTPHTATNVTNGSETIEKKSTADPAMYRRAHNMEPGAIWTESTVRRTVRDRRITHASRKRTVIDGPFAETKEYIGSGAWEAASS